MVLRGRTSRCCATNARPVERASECKRADTERGDGRDAAPRGTIGRGRRREHAEEPDADEVAKMNAPVLGLYGGADQSIPLSQIEAMRAAIKAAGKSSEIVVYPDTPHAFNADYRPSYRPKEAKDGWARMLEWFKKNGVA